MLKTSLFVLLGLFALGASAAEPAPETWNLHGAAGIIKTYSSEAACEAERARRAAKKEITICRVVRQ